MPNYSRRARVLRIKQTNGLNISTAKTTSPAHAFVMMPLWQFFMKFRGPAAHPNRPQKAMVCPTPVTSIFENLQTI
jgi:metal-dependent amidase/aminoacylase/carboxypeptidase family protein